MMNKEEHLDRVEIVQAIESMYRALLNRDPDPSAIAYYVPVLRATGDITQLVKGICSSAEFSAINNGSVNHNFGFIPTTEIPIKQEIVIVDIGAQILKHEGHVYSPLATAGYKTKVIGFEPLSHRLSERANTDLEQDVVIYPNFIGDGSKQIFHINKNDSTSSLLAINHNLTKHIINLDQYETVKTEVVKTDCLDEVIPIQTKIDFFKIDVQGFELKALKGAKELLNNTLVVHCEVSFDNIYLDQCLFADIDVFLRSMEFEFIDFVYPHRVSYNISSQATPDRLLWADAVFFKKVSTVEKDRIPIQAVIAQIVYGKYGLAEKILGYDAVGDK